MKRPVDLYGPASLAVGDLLAEAASNAGQKKGPVKLLDWKMSDGKKMRDCTPDDLLQNAQFLIEVARELLTGSAR